MNIREHLNDIIDRYIPETNSIQFGVFKIEKSGYRNIANLIKELKREDFDSAEKFSYFLRYNNQLQRKADRAFFENAFEDNFLEPALYLWMCNYLQGVKNWIR